MEKVAREKASQDFVGRYLDLCIAQYFNSPEDRQKYTLGEWLAEYLPKVCSNFVLEYLHPHD